MHGTMARTSISSVDGIRPHVETFRRGLLGGSLAASVPPLDGVDRRIAAAAVMELTAALATSPEVLLSYLRRYPEMLSPWRWFASATEFQAGMSPIADWATAPRPFTTTTGTGVRLLAMRPIIDVRAHFDLVLSLKQEIPEAAGAYRGDAAVGIRRRRSQPRASTAPSHVEWPAEGLDGLAPVDKKALELFDRIPASWSLVTRHNYRRVVVDLLRASGGLGGDPMHLYLAWLALPPQRRPLARIAWAAFVEATEAAAKAVHPVFHRFLSTDLSRCAGVDLRFPWPDGARKSLETLVAWRGARFIHRLQAQHLQFNGDRVVGVANPLRRRMEFEPIDSKAREALMQWLQWSTEGAGSESWVSANPRWRVPVVHPRYPVVATEALLRRLRAHA
jgi:hypothetical protein